MSAAPTIADSRMYCRACGYVLVGLPSNRCPECGREFDPGNPKSFLAHPRRVILRRVVKFVLILFCLTLPVDSYLGYLDWRFHQESKAIQVLDANHVYVTTHDTTPGWVKIVLRDHAAWLWKRADVVSTYAPDQPGIYLYIPCENLPQSMAAVATLKSLQVLDVIGPGVSNNDLAQIKGLVALQELNLNGANVTDTGLAQLKSLTALQKLDLRNTKVTNAGVAELQKSLPNCTIYH